MIKLLTPEDGQTLSLLSEAQRAFIADEEMRSRVFGELMGKWDDLVAQGTDDSSPLPVIFSWESDETEFVLELSLSLDMAQVREYSACGCRLEVYNLLHQTKYYWRVRSSGGASEVRSFCIEGCPRFMRVEGLTNVRDVGLWQCEDGGRIKQGMLYRGSEVNTHLHPTAQGLSALADDIGVKTDFDMRREAIGVETCSPLEDLGAKWVLSPQEDYAHVLTEQGKEGLREFFKVLACEDNYPIYMHCICGADRTGTLAFLVQGLLGVSIEDLILDYELTTLATWGIRTRNSTPFADFLKALDDVSLENISTAERIELMLTRDVLIPAEHIDAVKRILKEYV